LIRAVIAPHITDLTRYTGNGLDHQRSDEATISIIGQLDELHQIDEIAYAGYQIFIDHEQQRATHCEHQDPAITFKIADDHVLQVFLYGLRPDPKVLDVNVRMKNSDHLSLNAELHSQQTASFTTRMSGVDDWVLIVDTQERVDLITQSKTGTRENEEQRILPPGRHEIEIRPEFCERYALCLSPADDPYGSIEVKHSFIGEVGASSGRFLRSRNKLWLPPTRTLPSYVSLLIDCVTSPMADDIGDEMKMVDEVEVISSPDHAVHVENALKRFPGIRSKITIASTKWQQNNADIALIEPEDDVPAEWAGKVSCLLFNDQADDGFRFRLRNTLRRLERDPRLAGKALESIWVTSEGNHQAEDRDASYGVAWTTSSQIVQRGKVSLLRTMATANDRIKADVHRYAAQPFNANIFKV
jgi:hypothetical protein